MIFPSLSISIELTVPTMRIRFPTYKWLARTSLLSNSFTRVAACIGAAFAATAGAADSSRWGVELGAAVVAALCVEPYFFGWHSAYVLQNLSCKLTICFDTCSVSVLFRLHCSGLD